MTSATDPGRPRTRIALPAELGLAAAPALHKSLLDAFGTEGDCDLDARDVATVSTASLQVLLAAARHFVARGRRFTIAAPSQALTQAIADLGLSPDFIAYGASHG